MPNCSICNTVKTRLNTNGICKECRSSNNGSANDNESTESQETQHITTARDYGAGNVNDNDTAHNQTIETIDLDKPITEMSVRELLCLFKNEVNIMLETKVKVIESTTNNKLNGLEKRIELLESEAIQKDEQLETLTSIIKNMQRSINFIDFDKRVNNIMISGLSEDTIKVNDTVLNNDHQKVKHILSIIDCNEISNNDITITRIGKQREDVCRIIKVTLPNKEDRDKVLKKAPSLKLSCETWGKVYIKKDTHPVYVQETNRIRKKLQALKAIPGNEEKIKLIDGTLQLEGKVIDKNMFFC